MICFIGKHIAIFIVKERLFLLLVFNKFLKTKKHKLEEKVGWVLPTSNTVERSFSQTKYILTPERKNLAPMHLEAPMFLKFNAQFWNNELDSQIA